MYYQEFIWLTSKRRLSLYDRFACYLGIMAVAGLRATRAAESLQVASTAIMLHYAPH